MQGAGALAGTAPEVFGAGASVLTGAGALAGTAAQVFGEGASTLTAAAEGQMSGTASLSFGAGASILVGDLGLSAIASMVFGASLTNTQVDEEEEEVTRPRPDDGPSIYKPTGFLERKRKPRKEVEDRVEDSRDIQLEVAEQLAREFSEESSLATITPISLMSQAQIASEIRERLQLQLKIQDDEETILLISGLL
jgi:hypothetical protein